MPALWLAAPLASHAQPSTKTAVATRIGDRPPRIDGRLDDAVWRSAKVVDDLVQQRPVEGSTPSERTEVYLLYDEGAIYVGARLFRTDPTKIPRTITRRDGFANAERFAVTLDPQLDRRTGVGFAISAAGVKSDYRHTQDDEMRGRESQFDPVWDAAAQLDSLGWTAEMRIPYSQLRFRAAPAQRWGLQLDRWMPDKNEDVQWVMIPQRETGFISRFGTLEGIQGINPTRPVELVPYFAGDATKRAAADPGDPFDQPYKGRIGADAKFGIGSGVTVDVTVNPDFGQVDADPAEVNLSAFETFFDERRPFFTEGSEMVRGAGGQMGGSGADYFYSRRIGAAPHARASGDFVDAPRASTILGAAKLTGRIAPRLTLGALFALTGAEHARTFDVDTGVTRRVPVEPLTQYGVVRLQQEIGSQQSTLGGALTAVRRDFAGNTNLSSILAREAYYGGVDWRLRWQQGRYALSGFAGFSHVAGDTAAMSRLQRSSARYFQRPDATHLQYDPLRRSLTGYSATIRADKDAGRRILWGAQVKFESPEFEMNDFGRLQSADDIEYNADIQIRETLPGRYLQNWRIGFDTRGAWNYAGAHQENNWNVNFNFTLRNFISFNLRQTVGFRGLSDALTRGGPYMETGREWRSEYRINSPFGNRTGWRFNVNLSRDEFGGHRESIGGQLTLRPAPRWQFSMEPSYNEEIESRQYVTTLDAGRAITFNTRYVFGFIDRSTLSTKLRLNYAFSPRLTLEGYGEPFLSSGRYSRLGELSAPRSRLLREYGTDGTQITRAADGTVTVTDAAGGSSSNSFTLTNRDFNVQSFRSNVVLRWEWNPGSTLFVVWQQNRSTSSSIGDHVRVVDLFDPARAPGDNFLSVKMTYWFTVGR